MKKEIEPNPTCVYGNCLTSLAGELRSFLFGEEALPFERRTVVVPDMAMKEFLLRQFLSHPAMQLVAGVQILPLNQAIAIDTRQEKRIPAYAALSLAVEEKLWDPSSFHFESLQRYLIGHGSSEEKREKRIAQLSDELARLFGWYGLHGPDFLQRWLAVEDGDWQKWLWKELFNSNSSWSYPIESVSKSLIEPLRGKIAVFGFNYLPLSYLSFFHRCGATLFQLSPSTLFWGDFKTDKERVRAQRKSKGDLTDGHSLLSNWGKLYRKMLENIDSFSWGEKECYNEDFDSKTLLSALRSSLLNWESRQWTIDDSIQIHSVNSKLREIEVLRDGIESLLIASQKKGDSLSLREILVFAPDISLYAPYIDMVFGSSTLPFAIHGLELRASSSAVQGFFQWIDLVANRFSLSSLFELFENTAFRRKHLFSEEEICRLHLLCSGAKIDVDWDDSPNSWVVGIERLLLKSQAELQGGIGLAEMPLCNRFIELIDLIHSDLLVLSEKMGAAEWIRWALEMADKYFEFDWGNEPFFQELRALSLSIGSLKRKDWSFPSIFRIFKQISQRKSGARSGSDLEKITFSSLSSGRIVPAQLIWCLGMDEEAFPRSESKSALSALDEKSNRDYFPSRLDDDRGLFLELVLHAKKYLIFSYERSSSEDHQAQSFSLLLDELQQFIGKPLTFREHPVHSFDPAYFSEESPFKKSNWSDYLAAQAYTSASKKQIRFFHRESTIETQEKVVDLRDLKKFARHPLQYYLQKRLGIYLNWRKEEKEREFILSRLEKASLRKAAVKNGIDKISAQAQSEGRLPRGIFKDAALSRLLEESELYLEHLHQFSVAKDEIRTIHFSDCSSEGEGLLPAIEVPTERGIIKIVGTLPGISSQGLLFDSVKDLSGLLEAWPFYLAYRSAFQGPLLMTKEGKSFSIALENPLSHFSQYLDYFFAARQTPSPLMPKWGTALLCKTGDEWEKAVRSSLKEERSFYANDPYLNYLLRRGAIDEIISSAEIWRPLLQKVFYAAL